MNEACEKEKSKDLGYILSKEMEKKAFEEALRLSKEVRRDLGELSNLWTLWSYEELHSASAFTRITGATLDVIQDRLNQLEKCIRTEDLITISKGEWPVYNLVNYYDHLINLVREKERETGKEERSLKSLTNWRNTAGRFAQLVCTMEDAE
jgi:hypothetical protein